MLDGTTGHQAEGGCSDVRWLAMLRLTGFTRPAPEIGGFSSYCPELGVASHGETEQEALEMLQEAVDLFLEVASDAEVERRYRPTHFLDAHQRGV